MKRKAFLHQSALLTAGVVFSKFSLGQPAGEFPVVRTPVGERRFRSKAVDAAIIQFQQQVKNNELAWLFENCFPNTLDTTVDFEVVNGRPDTYVITGDIDAMWLRDSTAQVWPYLHFIKTDRELQQLVAGVINRQAHYVVKDPYANAFYKDDNKISEWKDDHTRMLPGVHEHKWEIDSLCYPVRLAYNYWKLSGDTTPFDANWKAAIAATLRTFREQQRKNDHGPYSFQRNTTNTTDTQPLGGYGYPVKPVGLICSAFRPSDDATVFPFLVPSNFFAVVSLKQAATMVQTISGDPKLAGELRSLAAEVSAALQQHAIVNTPHGKVYAYEVDGFGNHYIMDDANVPSLVSLPYLDAVSATDLVYQNTRRLLLSADNPYFFKGKAAEGIGGPHVGIDMIWPLSLITRGLTSGNNAEIKKCIDTLRTTHAGTGFMHESFHKDDPSKFTRKWFAWANTIFGEFLWKTLKERPQLLA